MARSLGHGWQLCGQFGKALTVHIADDRDDQAALGVHGDAQMVILFQDDLLGFNIEAKSVHTRLAQSSPPRAGLPGVCAIQVYQCHVV